MEGLKNKIRKGAENVKTKIESKLTSLKANTSERLRSLKSKLVNQKELRVPAIQGVKENLSITGLFTPLIMSAVVLASQNLKSVQAVIKETQNDINTAQLKKHTLQKLAQEVIPSIAPDRIKPKPIKPAFASPTNLKVFTSLQTPEIPDSRIFQLKFPTEWEVNSNFGPRIHPITGEKKMHNGADIPLPIGTELKSLTEGKVIFAGWAGGYGNRIEIETLKGGEKVITTYSHLDEINLVEVQMVSKDQIIGKSGSTGMSTGPHLHLELKIKGKYVNPMEPYILPKKEQLTQGGLTKTIPQPNIQDRKPQAKETAKNKIVPKNKIHSPESKPPLLERLQENAITVEKLINNPWQETKYGQDVAPQTVFSNQLLKALRVVETGQIPKANWDNELFKTLSTTGAMGPFQIMGATAVEAGKDILLKAGWKPVKKLSEYTDEDYANDTGLRNLLNNPQISKAIARNYLAHLSGKDINLHRLDPNQWDNKKLVDVMQVASSYNAGLGGAIDTNPKNGKNLITVNGVKIYGEWLLNGEGRRTSQVHYAVKLAFILRAMDPKFSSNDFPKVQGISQEDIDYYQKLALEVRTELIKLGEIKVSQPRNNIVAKERVDLSPLSNRLNSIVGYNNREGLQKPLARTGRRYTE